MLTASVHCGKVCGGCTRVRCHDEPTEMEPLIIEFVICSGEGCEQCGDGYVKYTGCPQRSIPIKMIQMASMSSFAEEGMLPDAGGLNDQDSYFIDFYSKLRSYRNQIRKGDLDGG